MTDQLISGSTEIAEQLLLAVEERLLGTVHVETAVWSATDAAAVDLVSALGDFVAGGGKRLRPAFCVWGYLGADGDPTSSSIIDLAAALELLHVFALVHDDVMDGSDVRRGLPSVNALFAARHTLDGGAGEARRFGEGMAVLAGDLALVLAERLLLDASFSVRAHWHQMQLELVRGQTLDLLATASRRVEAVMARRIAVIKSGRYSVVHPLALGALAAGRRDLCELYSAFGEPVGEAFQLRDDLIGAFGFPAETGKPVGADLRDGKVTTLLAVALDRASARGVQLLRTVGTAECDDATVVRIQQVLEECGARTAVERRIDELAAVAHDALDRIPIGTDVRDALHELTLAALWRSR